MSKLNRKLALLVMISCVFAQQLLAQGEFAGAKPRALIGKTYNNDKNLPGLQGYEYREVTLASEESDPEQFSVGVFQKGTTWLVFYSVNTQPNSDKYTILDVLIIKNVNPSQQVRTLLCRKDKKSDMEIVALTKADNAAATPAIKAWRFNRKLRKFETAAVGGIDCLNEEQL
ncbi:MAG TPA: hypothetical protein VFZ42_04565 [Chitinophagaceae bacterium]